MSLSQNSYLPLESTWSSTSQTQQTSIAIARSISGYDWSFVQAVGYALRFIIMKIVCEVDYLEDNEPIIYGPYAQRDCLDYNEFIGNE